MERAVPCVFLGHPYGKKAYKVMALDTHKFHTSRDIVFHEDIFPFSSSPTSTLFPIHSAVPTELPEVSHLSHNPPIQCFEPPNPRRSVRPHKAPSYLNDYVCTVVAESHYLSTLTNLSLQPPSLSYYCLANNSQHLLARLNFTEPQTYDQAASHPGWQQAMHQELQALE